MRVSNPCLYDQCESPCTHAPLTGAFRARIRSALRPFPQRVSFLFAYLIALTVSPACGGGPNADEAERAMREFQLAATLRDEGNVPDATRHLRTSLALDPENPRAHILMGYMALERGDLDTAERSLRKGIVLLRQSQGLGGSALAESRNLLGVTLMQKHQYDGAITLLRESAEDVLNTAPYLAWGNLGLVYYTKNDYPHALQALERAVQIQSRFCLGHYRLGQTYFAMGDFAKAEETLTRAIEADERCTKYFQDAWRLRGETRARLGQRADAISDFERCVELGAKTPHGQACQRFLETAN